MKILVADDEKLARERIISILESLPEKYLIEESQNGKETIEKMRNFRPDLIFLDINLNDIFEIKNIEGNGGVINIIKIPLVRSQVQKSVISRETSFAEI